MTLFLLYDHRIIRKLRKTRIVFGKKSGCRNNEIVKLRKPVLIDFVQFLPVFDQNGP